MKLNTRLSVAATLAAALVVPTAAIGADSAFASHPDNPAASVKSDAGTLVAHIKGRAADHRHVKGTFVPQQFSVADGQLMVTGVLHGVMTGQGKPTHFTTTRTIPVRSVNGIAAMAAGTSAAPTTAGTATPDVAMGSGRTVDAAAPACGILNLNLGPLDLDLLGLQVHLDKVVLNVVAQSGAGNLLGNLLCSVAGLLDNTSGGVIGGLLGQISDLLNQILGALAPAAA